MEVLELQVKDREIWDQYVHRSADATVFHLAGWKDVMEETFGLRSHYLLATEDDQILGVLPLLHVNSRLSGHYLTSMPGAVCAQNDRSARTLVERAIELVKAKGAEYLILRDSCRKWDLPDLVTNEDHCTLVVKLFDDPERIWMGVDKRVRQSTKKAIKAGLEVQIGPDGLDSLYPTYSRAMRDLGTPTLGQTYFQNLYRHFPDLMSTAVIRRERQVLGGGFIALFKGSIYNTWGGMLRQYYNFRPNYLLYWELLKYGCEHGFQRVDLGRSARNSGTHAYKKQWLAEPQPLFQQFYLNSISRPPGVGSMRASDIRYRTFVKVWRHLPLPVAEFLGPRLRKRMPFG